MAVYRLRVCCRLLLLQFSVVTNGWLHMQANICDKDRIPCAQLPTTAESSTLFQTLEERSTGEERKLPAGSVEPHNGSWFM